MRIQEIWIVTEPTQFSTLEDMCFKLDILHLETQFKGGLSSDQILRVFTKEKEAKTYANFILLKYKEYEAEKRK
jgi:hypothetical protein